MGTIDIYPSRVPAFDFFAEKVRSFFCFFFFFLFSGLNFICYGMKTIGILMVAALLVTLAKSTSGEECRIAGGVASHCTSIEAARAHELQLMLQTMGPGLRQLAMKRMKSVPKSFKELPQRNNLIRRLREECRIAGGVASHCTSIEAARANELQLMLQTMGPGLRRLAMKRMKSAPKSVEDS